MKYERFFNYFNMFKIVVDYFDYFDKIVNCFINYFDKHYFEIMIEVVEIDIHDYHFFFINAEKLY